MRVTEFYIIALLFPSSGLPANGMYEIYFVGKAVYGNGLESEFCMQLVVLLKVLCIHTNLLALKSANS